MLSQPTSTKNTKPYSFLTRTKPFCTHMRSPSPDYLWHSWHLTPPCVAGQNLPLKSATCTITSLAVQTSHMNFCSGSRRKKKSGIHILWKEWVPGLRGKEDHGIMTQCFWKIMYYYSNSFWVEEIRLDCNSWWHHRWCSKRATSLNVTHKEVQYILSINLVRHLLYLATNPSHSRAV